MWLGLSGPCIDKAVSLAPNAWALRGKKSRDIDPEVEPGQVS